MLLKSLLMVQNQYEIVFSVKEIIIIMILIMIH